MTDTATERTSEHSQDVLVATTKSMLMYHHEPESVALMASAGMWADAVATMLAEQADYYKARDSILTTLVDEAMSSGEGAIGSLGEFERWVRADERAQIMGAIPSAPGDGGGLAQIRVDAILAAVDDALQPFRATAPSEPGHEHEHGPS